MRLCHHLMLGQARERPQSRQLPHRQAEAWLHWLWYGALEAHFLVDLAVLCRLEPGILRTP
jgi:hypothetical protein